MTSHFAKMEKEKWNGRGDLKKKREKKGAKERKIANVNRSRGERAIYKEDNQ